MEKAFIAPISDISEKLSKRKNDKKLNIFVAGPYIEKGLSDEKLKEKWESYIRLRIKDHLEIELGHQSLLGEHRGVSEVGEHIFGEYSNLAIAELALCEKADAIIIMPCSAGSFCELGSWSEYDGICQKMLILGNNKYQKEASYLRLGTMAYSVSNGATLRWVDYSDEESLLSVVETHIARVKSKIAYEELRGRVRAR